jgi:membrane protein YqaA with SNARE-associated domain
MRLFKPLYEFALRWAVHPRAEQFLAGLSFIEAFIFPVAPEIMLAPMTLAKPKLWARYATVSLSASLLGSFVGYALGHLHSDGATAFRGSRLDAELIEIIDRLHDQSPWKTFALSFLPVHTIPLKIFTWASGVVGVPIPAFVAGMLIGRGRRVFAVAGDALER